MAIGGSPPNAPRDKDGAKGTAGRYGFVAEVQRGYLGALWLARDPSDATDAGTVLVRHLAPIHTASARGALLEAARFGQAAGSSTLEIIEGRTSVDLVTPFVDAEPLRSLLRTAALKHVPLEPAVLLGIAREVLGQIGNLHDAARPNKSPHGYGGLQPDSILVGLDGRVELIDAGVSAAASAREPWKSDVQRIGYFAPEQIDIRGVVDARTDVFALGILLWEAFGNRRLFPGADAKSARERLQKGAIARLDATRTSNSPGIAASVADLVAQALERDPAKRFQSAAEMSAALGALEPASAERIGAWVTVLAETAITKRRQLLIRSSIAPPAPRASLLPGRPSTLPGARPPLRTGSFGTKAATPIPAARTSVPAAAARPPIASALRPPPGAGAAGTPAAAAVTPAPTDAATAAKTPAPPPPVAETPVPEAAAAEAPAPEAAAAEAPAPGAAAATPAPPPSAPPTPAADSGTGAEAAPVDASQPTTPDSTVPTTQPSAGASSDALPTTDAASGNETSSEAIPVDGPDADTDAIDVTDEDLGAPPPPSPRPDAPPHSQHPSLRTSRPPRLPQDTTPSLELIGGDTSLLGAPAEPLAGPMPAASQLSVLTGPSAPRKRGLFLAIGAALVLGVGVGGWFMGRVQGPKRGPASGKEHEKPSLEAHVESVTAVVAPSASAEPAAPASAEAKSAAAPSAEPSASPPSSTEPTAAAPLETKDGTKAAPTGPEPAVPAGGRTSAPGGGSPASAASHRPAPPRGPINSGYKPGGI